MDMDRRLHITIDGLFFEGEAHFGRSMGSSMHPLIGCSAEISPEAVTTTNVVETGDLMSDGIMREYLAEKA